MRNAAGLCLSAMLALATLASAREIKVADVKGVTTALASAEPGDVIEVKAGEYSLGGGAQTGRDGTKAKPIVFRCAGEKGYAKFNLTGQVAFRVKNRFWEFRGIHFAGDAKSTEATVFMDGPGGCGDIHFVDCKISGSNTHGMKASKLREKPVHNVLIEHTELFDTGETGFDLVSGDNWVLRGCYVHDYGKSGGVTYGIFLKGGGKNGIIEGNIVDGKKQATTLGISFGGGTTGKQWLPVDASGRLGPEHDGGICRNNIVIAAADASYHSSNAANCRFYNNLAWNGDAFQRQGSYPRDPMLANNLIGGGVKGASESKNTLAPRKDWFVDPDNGDFRLTPAGKSALVGKGSPLPPTENPTDFSGSRRDPRTPVIGPVLPDARESTKWLDRRK